MMERGIPKSLTNCQAIRREKLRIYLISSDLGFAGSIGPSTLALQSKHESHGAGLPDGLA